MIRRATKEDYDTLITIWETSVSETHHFLSIQEISQLKTLILTQYFDAVTLYVFHHSDGNMAGFIGIAEQNIEMLFIAPSYFNQCIGSQLVEFSATQHNTKYVDVNEQNPAALAFYQRLGFKVINRSPLDGQGNPYPILHLAQQ